MIGILLALQVNNWNENRKAQREELALYTLIINDLKVDKEKLESILNRLKVYRNTKFQVYRESIGEAVYSPNIEYIQLRWGDRFNPLLKENNAKDIGLITNDSIRKQLNEYFKQEPETIEALEMSNKLRRGKLRDFLEPWNS